MQMWIKTKANFGTHFKELLSPLTVFIWATCIVVATVAGPFGTYSLMVWPTRALYWVVVVTVSIILGFSARAITQALVGENRPVLFDVVAVGLMTVVFAPVAWLITQFTQAHFGGQVQPLWVFVGYVMICAAAVFVGRRIAPGFEDQTYDFLPVEADNLTKLEKEIKYPRLLRRLSENVRGDILCLSANDHFVEVTTVNGSETVRLRLTDAMDEMEPVEGYCVHRSHWVARSAIVGIERENANRLFVVLSNGTRIPASRKYQKNLKDAGYI